MTCSPLPSPPLPSPPLPSRSILTAVEAHYKDPSNPYPGEDNAIMYELTPYLETAGINDPLSKVGSLSITVLSRMTYVYIVMLLRLSSQ